MSDVKLPNGESSPSFYDGIANQERLDLKAQLIQEVRAELKPQIADLSVYPTDPDDYTGRYHGDILIAKNDENLPRVMMWFSDLTLWLEIQDYEAATSSSSS